jgi:hypothetical protein
MSPQLYGLICYLIGVGTGVALVCVPRLIEAWVRRGGRS